MRTKAVLIIVLMGYCISNGIAQEKNKPGSLLANINDSTSFNLELLPPDIYPHIRFPQKKEATQLANRGVKHPIVHRERLVFSSIALISLNYAAYQPFKDVWWREERTNFHFYQGWRRNKGYLDFGWHDTLCGHMDKLGHFFSAKLMSEQIYSLSRWIGFDENSSKLIGPILSSLFMLEIEIYDGFFKDWGFSVADFTANELGAFSPLINDKISFFKYFQFKLSYHPSDFSHYETAFVKDYAGMTFWLSVDIHSALPGHIRHYCPAWLNLSLGYSVSKPTRGEVELYFSPDINWMKVPLGRSQTMFLVKRALNYFHFPCFAVKLMPDKKFCSIYY